MCYKEEVAGEVRITGSIPVEEYGAGVVFACDLVACSFTGSAA
jgi:hypothetical protein